MTEYGRIHTDGSRSGGQPVVDAATCRGSWTLGTACGKCSRCVATEMTNENKYPCGGSGTGLQSVISLCPHCGGRQTGGGGGVGTRFDDSNGRRMQSDGSSAQLAIGPDGNVVGMKVQAR